MKRFDGNVGIITGAGSGIGFEISRQLAMAGAKVILNDLDDSLAQNAAKLINAEAGVCVAVAGDAAEEETIQQLTSKAISMFGRLDFVVANAGLTLFGPFLEYSRKDFKRVVIVNLEGTFFLAQTAARVMIEQGIKGRIVFMSSVTGHQAHKNLTAYGMTKAGIEMLAKSLVVELSEYGITVNTVAPGATLTERTEQDPSYRETWSRLTPLKKPGTTKDVADAVLFLLSREAGHITGQTLIVDGGWSSTSPSPYD